MLNKDSISAKRILKSVMALAMALFILITCTTYAFAQDTEHEREANFYISAIWDGGDMVVLDIIDLDTMEWQQVAIRLSDFVGATENAQYILLQAMDFTGARQSEVIQIENPLFVPDPAGAQSESDTTGTANPIDTQTGQTVADSGSSIPIDELPNNLQEIITSPTPTPPPSLTPAGTGTVVDNIMTINDIEFFTVSTYSGNDFFLVIDRQRQTDNVYLLNMVTESDLLALANTGSETQHPGSIDVAAVPTPTPAPTLTLEEILQAIQESNEQNTISNTTQNSVQNQPNPAQQSASSGIFVLFAIVLVLGCGGYFGWKYVWPRLRGAGQGNANEAEDEDENDYDDEDVDYSEYEAVEADEDEDSGEEWE